MKKLIILLLAIYCPILLANDEFDTGTSPVYTTQQLKRLDRAFLLQLSRSDKLIRNPLALEYIQHLGKYLTLYSNHKSFNYKFFLVKSTEINAFAGPGGYIGINSGLIFATSDESELAAVMSHEIAHVQQNHLLKSLERQKNMRIPMIASSLAAIALGVLNPALGTGALMGSMTGYAQDQINFTRSNEKEADRLGINILYKAAFDPKAMAGFFKKMQLQERFRDMNGVPAILLTHPLSVSRIADAENRAAQFSKKTYRSNTEYNLFKETIRVAISNTPQALLNYYETKLATSPTNDALHFGYGLALNQNYYYQKSKDELAPLVQKSPENLYYAVALANAEFGLHNNKRALQIMHDLYVKNPDNFAAIYEYANLLIHLNKLQLAENVLLASNFQTSNIILLLPLLAQVQAQNHHVAQAYLTKARLMLLLDLNRQAVFYLKQARKLGKNNHLVIAQVEAMLVEAKEAIEAEK